MLEDVVKFKNSKEWIDFKCYCETGILEQIDFFRYEDMHTNFLASLLKDDNVYKLGTKPLKLFLELLKLKDESLFDKVCILANYSLTDIETITQFVLDCGRLDLLIKFKINNRQYNIILENKLFSEEGENQTLKYQNEIENNKDFVGTNIYVYLSLINNPTLSSDKSDFKDYIRLTYQDLIDYVLEPCSFLENNGSVSLDINEYLKSFTYLCEYGDKDSMPITIECKQLAMSLYDKYKDTLDHFLDSINNNDKYYLHKFYEDNENIFRVLFTVLSRLDLNNEQMVTKIEKILFGNVGIFKDKTYTSKQNTKLFYDLLKDMIQETKVLTKLSDLDDLKFSPRSTWKVAVTKEEYELNDRKDNYRYSSELKLEGKSLYYCTPILREELKGFVECINDKYAQYRDSEILQLFL